MRCKVVIKFACQKEQIDKFREDVKKIDKSMLCHFRNDMSFVNGGGTASSAKGMTLIMSYKKLPKLVSLVFDDYQDVFIASVKLLSDVKCTSDDQMPINNPSASSSKWSDEDIEKLKRLFVAGKTDIQIAEVLGRSDKAVESKRRKLKLKKKKLFGKLG